MDWQIVFNWIGGIATLAIAGFVQVVWRKQEANAAAATANAAALTEFRIEVAKNHPTHDNLRRMEDALLRIEAKLDLKADK